MFSFSFIAILACVFSLYAYTYHLLGCVFSLIHCDSRMRSFYAYTYHLLECVFSRINRTIIIDRLLIKEKGRRETHSDKRKQERAGLEVTSR